MSTTKPFVVPPAEPQADGAITGLVLAGGRGSRLGGRDKGLVEFRRRPMLDYVLAALRPQVDEVLISANRHLDWYRATGCRVVTDAEGDFGGPLAGILAGLRAVHTPYLVVVPCDGPLLARDLVARLRAACVGRSEPIAAACDGERLHPTFALIPVVVGEALALFLGKGRRKVSEFYVEQGLIVVDFSDRPEAFLNVNTPEDMARLEVLVQ